jgi:hypothetical protein
MAAFTSAVSLLGMPPCRLGWTLAVAQQFNTAFPYKKMIATSHTGYAKLLRLAICRPITANA